MRRIVMGAAAAAALAVAAAPSAQAAGICFDPRVPVGATGVVIVKRYSKPGRGSCKPFVGWASYYGAVPVSGAACLNSAGDELRVSYAIPALPAPLTITLELPYPSLAGGHGTAHEVGTPGWSYSEDAVAGPCGDLYFPMP
ncbi:MAG: hypothetical protein AB1689_27120 [Thermodesulfobacteriota bacterium]